MGNKDHVEEGYDAQIEEYRSLRQEIMNRQNARFLILGFTIAAIGTILGATLREEIFPGQQLNYYTFALISFALIIVIAASVLTIHHTQQIEVISAYIRKFIEPKVVGLGWESRWTRYREAKRSNPKAGGLPLGTSKPLAVYYALLTISIYLVTFVIGLYHHWFALIFVSILAVCSLTCSYDLYKRKTKGWRINWDVVDNQQ